MIAGLMREGKEFAGKKIAGKRKSLKKNGGNELGVVEGTTRISADPATVCLLHSLILFYGFTYQARARTFDRDSINPSCFPRLHQVILRFPGHRACIVHTSRVIVSAFYRQIFVQIIASLGRKT